MNQKLRHGMLLRSNHTTDTSQIEQQSSAPTANTPGNEKTTDFFGSAGFIPGGYCLRQQAMPKKVKIKWLSEPEEQDYPAARSYLSLLYRGSTAKAYIKELKRAPESRFKAKDIFRASGLSLLGISNAHVERDRQKIRSGRGLSPLLLVRTPANGKVIIADGYHRLCAVYSFDEDALIPCKIV